MVIIELKERNDIIDNVKLHRIFAQFSDLLKELQQKELPQKIINTINQDVDDINSALLTDNEFKKTIKKKQANIIKLLEKELKIVPKEYYKNLWMSLGISIFGIPIGVALGIAIFNNYTFFAIGIPIGMAIGIAIGSEMDKRAFKEGRQLNTAIKY